MTTDPTPANSGEAAQHESRQKMTSDIDSAGHAALSLRIAARNCTSNQQLAGAIRLTTEKMGRDELAALVDCLVVLLRIAECGGDAV